MQAQLNLLVVAYILAKYPAHVHAQVCSWTLAEQAHHAAQGLQRQRRGQPRDGRHCGQRGTPAGGGRG